MKRWLLSILITWVAVAHAEFQPESVGVVETLPGDYPDHWALVHDFSFFHMFEGEVLVIDPLGETAGDQYKGMMTASFIAGFQYSKKRNEHYVVETFYSRGARGGERTDVVTIYDPATLKVTAEIEIPAKRISGMPKTLSVSLLADDRFLAVYNFTPAQSVSIVDLQARAFVAEAPTAGCGFVIPTGASGFSSICSNGTILTTTLNADGTVKGTSRTEQLFDAENNPIFETATIVDGVAYFPTFTGEVLPLDVSGNQAQAKRRWWLTSESERDWRPGGMNIITTDAAQVSYVLMHPEGGEGTHKNGGSEVWVYDLATGVRRGRIELENWGVSLGTTGTGNNRLLFVTTAEMGVDVYRLADRSFLKSLQTGAVTPFLVHGTQ